MSESALPELPSFKDYTTEAAQTRTEFLEKKLGINLEHIREHNIDPLRLRGIIENFIGSVQIPVGMVGPLKIKGDYANGDFYAPFATVEGVITISATRGARAINESGGIRTRFIEEQMIRAPVFLFNNGEECEVFIEWLEQKHQIIKDECEKLSSHGKLTKIEKHIIGCSVHLRFCFKTGDAAGQNMTTIMTDAGCKFINKNFEKHEIRYYSVECNFAGDKKANKLNFFSSRGRKVSAEIFIPKETFEEVLRCDLESYKYMHHNGAAATAFVGTPEGFSVNAVNVIAAIYAATGQDLGCVYESGIINTYAEVRNDGVYWSALFPNIVVGTISPAQRLPSQKACLDILGCAGEGGANKLAEIIAAFCIALDLSTSASVASGSFAKAHQRWGR